MRSARVMLPAIVPVTLLLPELLAQDSPTPEEVLARIDEALWFHDHQPGLEGYSTRAVSWQGSETPPADPERLGTVRLDPGTRGKTGITTWVPGCGPWTLTHLMAFELELFARPWSDQFGGDGWTRNVERTDDGWTLEVVPARPIGGEGAPLEPAILGARFEIDEGGVPRRASLQLDMQFMRTQGRLDFEYDAAGERHRIRRVAHELSMANLAIAPVLEFRFVETGGLRLLDGVDFRVEGRQLSGSLGGAFVTRLRFQDYELERREEE